MRFDHTSLPIIQDDTIQVQWRLTFEAGSVTMQWRATPDGCWNNFVCVYSCGDLGLWLSSFDTAFKTKMCKIVGNTYRYEGDWE